MSRVMNKKNNAVDFDEEARLLWERLNLDPSAHKQGKWNPLDPIWRHPEGGGIIYVGNQTAAEDLNLLRNYNVTHVVNCTIGGSQIPNYHEKSGAIQYYRFPISHWKMYCDERDQSILGKIYVLPYVHCGHWLCYCARVHTNH